MQYPVFLLALLLVYSALQRREQQARIHLLGRYLSQHRIENLLAKLTQSYLRALGEKQAQRQQQIWQLLGADELELSRQISALAVEFASLDGAHTRVSKLAIALPYASQWWPSKTFDMRRLLSLHAHSIDQITRASSAATAKARAYQLLAELLLFQHSCHWFCRAKLTASLRLLAHHQTAYSQVLAAVAPSTRQAYLALLGKSA